MYLICKCTSLIAIIYFNYITFLYTFKLQTTCLRALLECFINFTSIEDDKIKINKTFIRWYVLFSNNIYIFLIMYIVTLIYLLFLFWFLAKNNSNSEPYTDPAMLCVLAGMCLMFIIICVVLRLFSK